MRTSDPDDDKSSHLSGDSFYEFSEDESNSSQSNSAVDKVKIEVLLFLGDKQRDFCILKGYPHVWQVFQKYIDSKKDFARKAVVAEWLRRLPKHQILSLFARRSQA
ncbi:hypothetical protein QYM36_017327 [Artemia franciscana]|uniref:Uncharacterized protein n=1 Tax=Artemia franciscana TaxID=6661 RepID=A0AA88HAH9_ARTSF|nr:hypothetical protein QYM36_017327 [Artemia franciscana]